MAMQKIKSTADYSIYKRGDDRFAVKNAHKQPVNGEEKVAILLAEGLITVSQPSAPAEEPAEDAAEEAVAEDAGDADAAEAAAE